MAKSLEEEATGSTQRRRILRMVGGCGERKAEDHERKKQRGFNIHDRKRGVSPLKLRKIVTQKQYVVQT